MSIHATIRSHRLRLGMTEQQLADRVGVTRAAVQQWEREGGTAPRRPKQQDVANALEISLAELLGAAPPAGEIAATHGEMLPSAAPAPLLAPGGPTLEQALEVVAQSLESLSPILQQAGKSTLEKWVHGQASLAETATTLAALAQASQSLPSAPAVAETPVPKPQNT